MHTAHSFGVLVGNDRGHCASIGEQRAMNFRRGADDHGYGHGFTESAAEAEDDGADDTDAGVAQNAHADHLPSGGADGENRLPLRMRNGGHDFAGERRDDGQNHDGQNDSGGEITEAGGVVVAEKTGPAKGVNQQRIYMFAEQGHENKDGPEAIDDAWNCGQQLSKKSQRNAQGAGAHFRKEDGEADGERDRHEEGQKRRDQGSVNERARTELFINGVPKDTQVGVGIGEYLIEKGETELVPGKL